MAFQAINRRAFINSNRSAVYLLSLIVTGSTCYGAVCSIQVESGLIMIEANDVPGFLNMT